MIWLTTMLWAFSYIHIKNFFVRFDLFFPSLYIEALFITTTKEEEK